MKTTAQGVRNLNGPKLDGEGGYNGRSHAPKDKIACPHMTKEPEYRTQYDHDGGCWIREYVGERCCQCNTTFAY